MTRRLPLLALPLVLPLGACQAAGTRVTDVIGIDVTEGINTVPHFVPDGREGVIVVARRPVPSGVAHPSELVTVMLPRFAPTRGWDVVGVEDAAGALADGPLADVAGEGARRPRAVRFARAKVGGLPATLMFVATAEANPNAVGITTYRLLTDGEDASGLAAVFGPFQHTETTAGYCSPEAALEAVERLDPVSDGSCAGSS